MNWSKIFIPVCRWRVMDLSGCGLIDNKYITLASYSNSQFVSPVRPFFLVGTLNLKRELELNINICHSRFLSG